MTNRTRNAQRLKRLVAGAAAAPIDVDLKTVFDPQEKRELFPEHVVNRYDDADPAKLERYCILVTEDDEVRLEFHRTRKSLIAGLEANDPWNVLATFDLDAARVMHPRWITTVKLPRAPRSAK